MGYLTAWSMGTLMGTLMELCWVQMLVQQMVWLRESMMADCSGDWKEQNWVWHWAAGLVQL